MLQCGYIDGTEALRSKSKHRSCPKCRISVFNKGEADESAYYHENILDAAHVGKPPNLVLRLEHIAKDEVTTAIRLLKSLYQRHFRYADICVFDALIANSPVIKKVFFQNKIAVIRVKLENYKIIKDAGELFSSREPDLEDTLTLNSPFYGSDQSGKSIVKSSESGMKKTSPGLHNFEIPLRVLKVEEIRISASGKELSEKTVTCVVTTASKITLSTKSLRRLIHRRWNIENKVFNEIKNYWGFKHSFHHEETAFMAMRWLIVLAFNLFSLFYLRRISQNGR